ncbi:MAG: phosphate ABC transporter ATP-binding protein [Planctomycetes bacterium]|nr:phosphate ABC transporter ATP-binding protein [Planctomycetota bacterium]
MVAAQPDIRPKIRSEEWSVWYGERQVLRSVTLGVRANEILSIIGPANSGKTTFLRSLNRLIDVARGVRTSGRLYLDEEDIREAREVEALRKRVGMVLALPAPLNLSVFENVAYGPRRHHIGERARLEEIVEKSLRAAYLWDEVKDRLHVSGFALSGGQQQRLCIARTLAVEPEVILFDEPCSGLDPISTARVEEAMIGLKKKYTQVLVTNNNMQAARVGDRTAFFLMGELIELGETRAIFTAPKNQKTEGYLSGRFG